MKIRECMTSAVRTIDPESTLQDAARIMAEADTGAVPVAENDRLVGMITDRDIVVRAVCQGKGPDVCVREVMTPEIKYCFEDDDVEAVAENMAQIQVRRLPVVTREKRLVGIVALSDLTKGTDPETTGEALAGISRPGGQHNQSETSPTH